METVDVLEKLNIKFKKCAKCGIDKTVDHTIYCQDCIAIVNEEKEKNSMIQYVGLEKIGEPSEFMKSRFIIDVDSK